MNPRTDGTSPRYNCSGSARGHLLGEVLVFWIRDTLLPELEVLGPELNGGPESEVSLGERNARRERGNGIGWKVMGLKTEPIQERSEELARRESKAALEMRDEDHAFTGFQLRLGLCVGNPAYHLCRNSFGPDQPVYLGLGYVGTFPPGALTLFDDILGRLRGMAG